MTENRETRVVATDHLRDLAVMQKMCTCGTVMIMQDRADISGGCCWRCPDCHKRISIRKGSFFEKSKLTIQKWLLLIHWWYRQYPVTHAAEEVGVSEATAVQVYQWMRDACSYRLCTLDPPIKLGGSGLVVAIDESLFSHKPKVHGGTSIILLLLLLLIFFSNSFLVS